MRKKGEKKREERSVHVNEIIITAINDCKLNYDVSHAPGLLS